jgi:hypothetical protein
MQVRAMVSMVVVGFSMIVLPFSHLFVYAIIGKVKGRPFRKCGQQQDFEKVAELQRAGHSISE